jgi:hypothetical protein
VREAGLVDDQQRFDPMLGKRADLTGRVGGEAQRDVRRELPCRPALPSAPGCALEEVTAFHRLAV